MSVKLGVAGVFAIAFLFLAVSSFSMDECQYDSYCEQTYGWGWTCENHQCIPPNNVGSSPCMDQDLRQNISGDFGITINDSCELDSRQLQVIYAVLKVVPKQLYNVSKITTATDIIYRNDIIVVPSYRKVGETKKDSIPDGIAQYADEFSIDFVYRLNQNIRAKSVIKNPVLESRENLLIYNAYYLHDSKNYIRSDYDYYYFVQYKNEFFPRISEAYFQDSNITFRLSRARFLNNFTEPVNQFLFFADLYSMGSNRTMFYTLNESGGMTTKYALLERNNKSQITSLALGDQKYLFELDFNGNVKKITMATSTPPSSVCSDGTKHGNCSTSTSYGKPWYCYNGTLVKRCSLCGCGEGLYCENTGDCSEKCEDRTPYYQCSNSTQWGKPWYCDGFTGMLIKNCNYCGCNPGYLCENSSCVAKCSDGTPWGNCSKTIGKPWYCDKGTLAEKCSLCGCYPYSFCTANDSCQYNQTTGNHPPALNHIGNKIVREGELLEFDVSGFDVDQDPLSYYVSSLPEGAKFEKLEWRTRFRWTPNYDQARSYEVIFTVSDGRFNVSEKITINVTNVNRKPRANIYYPSNNQEFHVDEIIPFSGKGSEDPDKDQMTYFWYFGDGGTAVGLTDEHAYQDPGTYNVTLEVSDGKLSGMYFIILNIKSEDEPIPDEDRDGVDDPVDKCPDTVSLEKVNIYGCPLPEYTKFKNNVTTDFEKIDLLNASNITIGIPGKAKIEFRKNTINLVNKNLDKYVEIDHMTVEIKTENIPELNRSAVVTFYYVNIIDPVILKDGKYCPECKVITHLVDGTFVFSVPHFTKYSLMAWASFSGQCGDKLCSIYETCYDCPDDCGQCKEPEPPTGCDEYWICGPWSLCNELNLKTRNCNDISLCGTERKKPKEIAECKEEPFPSLAVFGIIVFILTTIYIVTERYKKKREMRKLGVYEIHEIIKGYMYRGFDKDEIVKMLKARGYKKGEINKLIKEVEKEMF